jgi:hypothetical protein
MMLVDMLSFQPQMTVDATLKPNHHSLHTPTANYLRR